MAAVTMICRVCGKEYTACRNAKKVPGVFRWQEVACSPECGEKYLAAVTAARAPAEAKPAKRAAKKSIPVETEEAPTADAEKAE